MFLEESKGPYPYPRTMQVYSIHFKSLSVVQEVELGVRRCLAPEDNCFYCTHSFQSHYTVPLNLLVAKMKIQEKCNFLVE